MAEELIVDFPAQPRHCSMSKRNCNDNKNDTDQGSRLDQEPLASRSFSCHDFDIESSRHCQQPSSARHQSHKSISSDSHDPTPSRSVHFSETSWAVIVSRHDDREGVYNSDLWYARSDIKLMKLAAMQDVLVVHDLVAAGVSIDRLIELEQNTDLEKYNVCLTGIESRLTEEGHYEVGASRARCVLAVLLEQAKLMSLSSLIEDWQISDMIALASSSQTSKTTLNAQRIGLLHQEYVEKQF